MRLPAILGLLPAFLPALLGCGQRVPHIVGVAKTIRQICKAESVQYPPERVFLRVFKTEGELELWGSNGAQPMRLLQTYPIAAESGGPDPKRREGDLQVPEGVYRISQFNPHSQFHLSMRVDYPNASDRVRSDPNHPGSDIFIHGNQVSIGCLAMTDEKIEEIYALCKSARGTVPVHIFPCRMQGATYRDVKLRYPTLQPFWRELEPIYRAFERSHVVPRVDVDRSGAYRLRT